MCPKADQSLLCIGDLLRNRFRVQEIVGRGGYGQIYQALDEANDIIVAIKAEPTHRKGRRARRMILEQRVLLKLQGRAHVPLLLQSGTENNVNFIVMQLLSRNVGQFRKECPLKRLSKSTCGRIMQQAIAGLRDLHQIGYVHRDLKPANICFGLSDTARHRLFVIDYGLVRRFRDDNGELRAPRRSVGFRGTLRYASLRVHRHRETGPADDLASLFYTFLELLRGTLPWRKLSNFDDVKEQKERLELEAFVPVSAGINDSISQLGQAIAAMSNEDEPNYAAIQDIMNELIGGRTLSDPYDWEDAYAEVMAEEDVNRSLGLIV